ncbi:hypothetical protein HKD27_04155 [Gluconobacter sp. R75690]|uniref:hypothetical protein n=1 Tax=unclassified Gluconobacter TaxID=2644261 RepID=UPI00188B316A|nr:MULTISPECIES: hypothetical protein [unclassified Gluconobacter]MBF0850116.1 hypothetical protein [Gluconobacter sp. R75690]MBF0879049.1 hypothetical protein [Gluconobacter sp. R75828]
MTQKYKMKAARGRPLTSRVRKPKNLFDAATGSYVLAPYAPLTARRILVGPDALARIESVAPGDFYAEQPGDIWFEFPSEKTALLLVQCRASTGESWIAPRLFHTTSAGDIGLMADQIAIKPGGGLSAASTEATWRAGALDRAAMVARTRQLLRAMADPSQFMTVQRPGGWGEIVCLTH